MTRSTELTGFLKTGYFYTEHILSMRPISDGYTRAGFGMIGFQVKMIGIKDAKFMLKAQEDDLVTELLGV
jgi:hypothetical protein